MQFVDSEIVISGGVSSLDIGGWHASAYSSLNNNHNSIPPCMQGLTLSRTLNDSGWHADCEKCMYLSPPPSHKQKKIQQDMCLALRASIFRVLIKLRRRSVFREGPEEVRSLHRAVTRGKIGLSRVRTSACRKR